VSKVPLVINSAAETDNDVPSTKTLDRRARFLTLDLMFDV